MNQRQQEILLLVQQQGFVAIETLAQNFKVTPQTIRRDINTLCDKQLLTRFHGGAGLSSSIEGLEYSTRQVMHLAEKRGIAQLTAQHIPDRASIFINIGTTTEEVAKALQNHSNLRIITNNLNVASILRYNPSFDIIIAGGSVRQRDGGITGEAGQAESGNSPALADLSKRGYQVAALVAEGLNNRDVADRLDITERTVKAHLSSAYAKTSAKSRLGLARLFSNA